MKISTKNICFYLMFWVFSFSLLAQQQIKYPYSIDNTNLTIWNGTEYVPFFIKGVNLGIAVPGTFPGELAATTADYNKWFVEIKEAGFNCIRIYTLHYPRFFEALKAYNEANSENPLLFFQGVWLEEEIPDNTHNLYDLSASFTKEIEDNVSCVHGDRTISHRFGKAYGTYVTDVSKWCLGYIIGREVSPIEIEKTNELNVENQYLGAYFSCKNASPSEAFFTQMLDHIVAYEEANYLTQRPVSVSSWPTLDPLEHPGERHEDEDSQVLDFQNLEISDIAHAGFFISYHAYPYYPDFISEQPSYQLYQDDYGPNSYLGYLLELKTYYEKFPVIIAEFGVPSSWAIAHYASSGMNHGGFDEYNQGLTNIRLLETIQSSNCGGGIQFSWIDEWFKRTWITDPVDYIPDSRRLWDNLASVEQNFGLIAFEKELRKDTIIPKDPLLPISYVIAKVDYASFNVEIGLKAPLDIPDELWVALDTYSAALGESVLPSGVVLPSRSEFALKITNYSAKLFVTQAYDIFGIWHNNSSSEQLYHSIATDGAPWDIVRIRNNSSYESIQYVGNLQVNYDFQPFSSKDAVIISNNRILVKIPWSYINVVAPDQMKVLDDYRNTSAKEDVISDGFLPMVYYKDKWYTPSERYKWAPWVNVSDYASSERLKTSYYVMVDNLIKFNTPAVAVRDSFSFIKDEFPVSVAASNGFLKNDFDLDGNYMASLLVENPPNGFIYLNSDGSFDYMPDQGFSGVDSLTYCIYDGYALSKENSVYFVVDQNNSNSSWPESPIQRLLITPNPCSNVLTVYSQVKMDKLQIFSANGKQVAVYILRDKQKTVDVSDYQSGSYIVVAKVGSTVLSAKFIKK